MEPFRILDYGAMYRRTADIFQTLTSEPRTRDFVKQMSGGQRQAVSIARTMLAKAKIVLMDEPTAAISVRQVAEVLNLMRRRTTDPVVYERDGTTFLKMGNWLRKVPPHYLDVDAKLAVMDASGIAITMLSTNDPGPEWFGDDGPAVARMANEAGTSAPVNATLYAAVKPYCMGRGT